MKKVFCAAVIIGLLFASPVFGQEKLWPSALKSADALIYTGETMFCGIAATGDGTNAITFDVHDGTTTGGAKVIPTWNVPQSASSKTQAFNMFPCVQMLSGVYVNITTTGTVEYVVYLKQ